MFQTINFKKWIEDNRHLLKPPVGNKMIWEDREFIVMVVGGPNSRKDFHVNEGEEFFYQLEGDINLKMVRDGKPVDFPIKEGDIFLLPPNVPHSPRRPKNTVGLVVERKRRPGEQDGFLWFCEDCGNKLHEEFIPMTNIEKDLPVAFDKFYTDESKTKCGQCGSVAVR